ncbi:collagen alpha-1(I) chain-like isoform X9 [Aquila chrysaetos chrysaetos]|uniref:collagen alpha-1(I) chain-like isoform X9 n=1 Tax=Aquila chrysaetos chrysaetos TaxID=223781 RepID=UPI001B7D392D|nr:collagen alpha-1(I) chain-like isoform X9 [Aquila chrysaetos chrysaetos]
MCSLVLLLLQLGADPAGAFSSLGPGPGRAFGKMFSPAGCRREFLGCSREPGPWQTGPPPPSHAHGPQDVWDKPPWEHQHRRGRGGWCPRGPWDPRPFPGPADFHGNKEGRWAPHDCPPSPSWDDREDRGGPEDFFGEGWHRPGPWDPRPFPGPADFHGNEEDRRWATHNRAPPPPWDDREDNQGPEDYFGEDWDQPGPWDPRPFPGPPDFHGNEEDRRWAPHDRHPPPHWNDREENQGPEDCFGEGWHREPWSGPSCFAWSEFPGEEQHPPWPPASLPGERGGFQDGCPSWGYHGLGGKRGRRLRRGHRELTLVQRFPCSWLSRGNRPFCKSSHSLPGTSQPGVKEQQHSASPQPLMSCKGDVLSTKHTAQGPPAASKKVPEPPGPASSPQKSPATDPRAATEAAEPEQAAEAASVEPGARQKPAGSHSQVETALETEPAPPEKSPAGTGEQLEVEPCSQSVPKAGADGGSHPHSPTAPPEPAEKVHATAGSAGEAGAELCPCSGGEQHLQDGAEEAKGEAACDELLGVLQPSDNSQVPPGATVEPDAQPSQACSDICAAPETSPGTQHPPGSGETEPAADSQHQLCSTLPTPSPASTDLRSAAVLARKEEIELSYQQFSLTIAVVATMLLQKEPSMEPALGLALRANLRQGRIHHLQELEDFINSYDSATLSR